MLVYDVTTEKSFENIRNWIRNIEEVCACTNNRGVESLNKARFYTLHRTSYKVFDRTFCPSNTRLARSLYNISNGNNVLAK